MAVGWWKPRRAKRTLFTILVEAAPSKAHTVYNRNIVRGVRVVIRVAVLVAVDTVVDVVFNVAAGLTPLRPAPSVAPAVREAPPAVRGAPPAVPEAPPAPARADMAAAIAAVQSTFVSVSVAATPTVTPAVEALALEIDVWSMGRSTRRFT